MSGYLIKYVGKLSYCFFIRSLVQVEAASLWDGAAGEAAEILCASTAQKKATLCFSDAVCQTGLHTKWQCVHLWYTVCHSTRCVIGYEWTPQVFPFINLSWAFSFCVSVKCRAGDWKFLDAKETDFAAELTLRPHRAASLAPPVWAAAYLWEATGSSCFFQLHFQFLQRPNSF